MAHNPIRSPADRVRTRTPSHAGQALWATGLILLILGCVAHKAWANRSPPDTVVHVYRWVGPHGVTHFSATPPPKPLRTTPVRQFTIKVPHVSRQKARAQYLASLDAARSMDQGVIELEKVEGVYPPAPTPAPVPAYAGREGAAPRIRRVGYGGVGFYPAFGYYPPELAPPLARAPATPPPDLSPPSGGFGICGYEIACPPLAAPPPPLAPPAPPVAVPRLPPPHP